MSTAVAISPPKRVHKKWTRADYDLMVKLGILTENDYVELINGEIIQKMPKNRPHSIGVNHTRKALERCFGEGFNIEQEISVALLDDSEPEPDIVVLKGVPTDYPEEHPTTALLIVEVAESSLSYDLNEKASLYAKAGIQDYWIVNLVDCRLEVLRQPAATPGSIFGSSYTSHAVFGANDTVSPLAKTDAHLRVADLLP